MCWGEIHACPDHTTGPLINWSGNLRSSTQMQYYILLPDRTFIFIVARLIAVLRQLQSWPTACCPMLAVCDYADRMCRENSALTPDSTRNEAALNAYLFQLVKAGRVSEASSTCEEAGQPWRAAALQGGGSYGPIPLGKVPALHVILCPYGFKSTLHFQHVSCPLYVQMSTPVS